MSGTVCLPDPDEASEVVLEGVERNITPRGKSMDQKTVRKLERELDKAIAEVFIVRNKNWMYPLMPSQNTLHLMAKAAVAVYESAAENQE